MRKNVRGKRRARAFFFFFFPPSPRLTMLHSTKAAAIMPTTFHRRSMRGFWLSRRDSGGGRAPPSSSSSMDMEEREGGPAWRLGEGRRVGRQECALLRRAATDVVDTPPTRAAVLQGVARREAEPARASPAGAAESNRAGRMVEEQKKNGGGRTLGSRPLANHNAAACRVAQARVAHTKPKPSRCCVDRVE